MHYQVDLIQQQQKARAAAPAFQAREVLEAIARPRLTGSEASVEVIAELKQRLESFGYEVRESPFRISTWPGRFGMSLAGVIYLVGVLLAAGLLYSGHPGISLVVVLAMFLVIGALASLAGPAMNLVPWGRVQAVNLLAYVPGRRPRYYVMAHHDTKSQPLPLAFRGPAIVFAIIAWLALLVAATAGLVDPIWSRPGIAVTLGTIGSVSALILIFCWVDNRSPGALDNASGVATLLGVAQHEATRGDVAFLITDAEELGLAGARALAATLPPSFGVINIDGVDDDGDFHLIERFGWPRKRGAAPHLAAALLGAAAALDLTAHRRDVPIGLLLDHMPVVRAGTPALTLMKGRLASLRRVHRPADNLDHLNGSGVEQGVTLVSGALDLLRQQSL